MRRLLLLFLFLLPAVYTTGQQPFSLRGYTVNPPDNMRVFRWGCRGARGELGESIGPRHYVAIQFSGVPTVEQRDLLRQRGVQLDDYLGGNAYFASLPVAKSYRHLLKGTSVVSVFQLPAEAKCSWAIMDSSVPGYAKEGSRVGVVVGFFEGLEQDWIEKRLGELGIEGVHMVGESFHRFRVFLPREKVLELAAESWVKSVSMLPPP